MELKDLAANTLSLIALAFSVYATVKSQRNSDEERRRTIRGQLTDVLGKLTALNIKSAKLVHEAQHDPRYAEAVGTALSQQNGFLLDQADFLSEQITSLVTTYEFNTIAVACANAGDMIRAKKYHKLAIRKAQPGLYKSQATRSYASFLFAQGLIKEGREQFGAAINLITGENNLVHWTNGMTYQWWGRAELQFARAPEIARQYFDASRKEYAAIDIDFMRNNAIASLESDLQPLPREGDVAPGAAPSDPSRPASSNIWA